MAINVTSSNRPDPVQLNLRESRAARTEQRAEQNTDTRRSEQSKRTEKDDAITSRQVKENREAASSQARANDDAAAAQRRETQQADQKADSARRDEQKTLGRNIDTTA